MTQNRRRETDRLRPPKTEEHTLRSKGQERKLGLAMWWPEHGFFR